MPAFPVTSTASDVAHPGTAQIEDGRAGSRPAGAAERCETSRWAVFAECPHCAGEMAAEHAHYRCTSCGWRDSCCD